MLVKDTRKQPHARAVIWSIISLALLLVLCGVVVVVTKNSDIKSDRYQLVKLTTGEIFFGKLQNTSGDYLRLENAYYIQDSKDATNTTILSRKSTVAKSDSPMYIKTSTVAYWENLAADSKIAETMKSAGNQ